MICRRQPRHAEGLIWLNWRKDLCLVIGNQELNHRLAASFTSTRQTKLLTSSRRGYTRTRQNNNSLRLSILDVFRHSLKTALCKGIGRDVVVDEAGFVLAHSAGEPARDAGSAFALLRLPVAVAASSAYDGGKAGKDIR